MDPLTQTWVNAARDAFNSLQKKFEAYRGLLLTEGDLECHLFNELMLQPQLSGCHPSKSTNKDRQDGYQYKTSFVHSQVTWFKPDKKSGFEVDLMIVDPAKLAAMNVEQLEDWPSKGFIYDGECVAIEAKFIRKRRDCNGLSHEDLRKLRDKLIPAKLENIEKEFYKVANHDNIAFISVVGCKSQEIFDEAKVYIGKHLADESKPCPENLFVCLFFQDDLIWDKVRFIEAYNEKKLEMEKKREEKIQQHQGGLSSIRRRR